MFKGLENNAKNSDLLKEFWCTQGKIETIKRKNKVKIFKAQPFRMEMQNNVLLLKYMGENCIILLIMRNSVIMDETNLKMKFIAPPGMCCWMIVCGYGDNFTTFSIIIFITENAAKLSSTSLSFIAKKYLVWQAGNEYKHFVVTNL